MGIRELFTKDIRYVVKGFFFKGERKTLREILAKYDISPDIQKQPFFDGKTLLYDEDGTIVGFSN